LAPMDTGGAPQQQGINKGSGAMAPPPPPKPAAPPASPLAPTQGSTNPAGELPQPMDPKTSRNEMQSPSRAYGQNNPSQGFEVGGGILGTAEQAAETAASMAANMAAPGSGVAASQATNMAFQLANRAIGYAGQLAGIGISGIMETFLPNNSPLADPGNNIFGKMAMGISGMHPTDMAKNLQQSAPALNPRQDLDQGAQMGKMLPQVHMPNATINNYDTDHTGMQNAFTRSYYAATGGVPITGSGGVA
jgi:hypothetical protein